MDSEPAVTFGALVARKAAIVAVSPVSFALE